ncbi:MAG: hypothetical protein FWG14_04125 [Peptococcaceae bacterium]|nr:hypothetical protein [Peptococcaceae bacterium]
MAQKMIGRGIALILTIAWAIMLNFLAMPAWTFQSAGFWVYCIVVITCGCGLLAIGEAVTHKHSQGYLFTKIAGGTAAALLVILLIASFPSWPLFNATSFRDVITIPDDGNFDQDVPRVQNSQDIPIVDMLTARQLGDRTMGTMGTMGSYMSQYEVDGEYNLIRYRGDYYRISPMNYGGLFQYNNSKNNGIPGYVLVNIYTQEAELVELGTPMKYSPSAHFGDLLKRHLRKQYPSYIFGKAQFEIDEEGTPFYIVPIERPTAGLFGARTVDRIILVNAVTGDTTETAIEDVPDWVDHVFSVSYIMERVDWYYGYTHGFWNASFSKKDVYKTSYSFDETQYYFIAREDGVYLYTGITSAGNDESNTGFVLANMRTGEIKYYASPGAEESSAQASAEGVVQQFGYQAGPVMLVNIDGIETYFMTLKDNQGLVKKIALVNKKNYTISIVEDTVAQAVTAYRSKFSNEAEGDVTEKTGTISELYTATKGGDTYFYFKLQDDNVLYVSSISNNDHQVTMEIGNTVAIEYVLADNDTALVSSITIK